MNNIVKHAEATSVKVQLTFEPDCFLLRVTDNGKGFDEELIRRGRGLNNLEKRSSELFGTLDYVIDHGTMVRIEIPLPIEGSQEDDEDDSEETTIL